MGDEIKSRRLEKKRDLVLDFERKAVEEVAFRWRRGKDDVEACHGRQITLCKCERLESTRTERQLYNRPIRHIEKSVFVLHKM